MMNLIYTSKEAAEMLRTSPNAILELLDAGEIPAYREGRNWKIPRACLEEYIIRRAEKESEERRKA